MYCNICNKEVEVETDEGGNFCVNCNSLIDDEAEKEIECNICEEEVPSYIYKDGFVQIEEWLSSNDSCELCKRKGCCYCLTTCYYCGLHDGNNNFSLCLDCIKTGKREFCLTLIDCDYHKWYACNNHLKEKCGQCFSNKNYHRHDMF